MFWLSELRESTTYQDDGIGMATFVNKSIRELHGHLSGAMISVFDSMRTSTPECGDALMTIARLVAEAQQTLKGFARLECAVVTLP